MASQQELRKAIEHTTRQFLGAYKEAGEHNDPALVNRDVSDSCKRFFKPAAVLTLFGTPPEGGLSNADYEAAMTMDLKRYVVTQTEISDLTIDTEARKSGATTVTSILYKDGEKDVLDHAWALDFNEDGSKVTRVMEFCEMEGLRRMVAKVYTENEGGTI